MEANEKISFSSDIPQGTYPTEDNVDGATGAGITIDQLGTEAALDIQSSWPLIWPQKVVMFQVDDQYYERAQLRPNSPFIGFYNSTYSRATGAIVDPSSFSLFLRYEILTMSSVLRCH